jgi:hypothetical protein
VDRVGGITSYMGSMVEKGQNSQKTCEMGGEETSIYNVFIAKNC